MAKKPAKEFDEQQIQALSYEQAYEQLHEIVEQIEQGQVGLEASVARYEYAMKLIAHCRRVLQQAEQKVLQLQQDSQGRPAVEPFQLTTEPDESAKPVENSGQNRA